MHITNIMFEYLDKDGIIKRTFSDDKIKTIKDFCDHLNFTKYNKLTPGFNNFVKIIFFIKNDGCYKIVQEDLFLINKTIPWNYHGVIKEFILEKVY